MSFHLLKWCVFLGKSEATRESTRANDGEQENTRWFNHDSTPRDTLLRYENIPLYTSSIEKLLRIILHFLREKDSKL